MNDNFLEILQIKISIKNGESYEGNLRRNFGA